MTYSLTVARPTDGTDATLDFPTVNSATYDVAAAAFASTNGSGTALAYATQTNVVVANHQTASVPLDLSSTISSVSVTQVVPGPVYSYTPFQLSATALDISGGMIPVRPQPDGFYWTSSDPLSAPIDQTGTVSAIGNPGTITFTAMEAETGITGTITIVILPGG